MIETCLAPYRLGRVLLGDLAGSMKAAFHDDAKTALPMDEQFASEPNKKERSRVVKFKQIIEDVPSCPTCGAMTEDYGRRFASEVVVGGTIRFCNNPACNGGQRSEAGKGSAQLSGGKTAQ